MALLGTARHADAQARRCDLVGRDTVVSGVPMKRCLDLAALRNQTITLPSNVTRIDNDGLALCNSSFSSGGDADIAYVYDNSGSMAGYAANIAGLDPRAWVSSDGRDTIFYFRTSGCPSGSEVGGSNVNGTITIQEWNAQGTGTVTRSVPRLRSNAGCDSRSGDPYNSRGRAFRLGIQNQAARAPLSTAGIMSFTDVVRNVRTPRRLNSNDNLTYILDGINAVSNGGTGYHAPLDTSKRWLTTSITPNTKKAIIFISDGRPGDLYLDVLDSAYDRSRGFGGTMPPIYGIFLGNPIPDTANLADLSRRTGGRFYLIPPNRPDSLIAVVDRILDVVLLEYVPNAATVTNSTLAQSASAAAPGGFTLQTNGSWRMNLDNIVALGSQTANQMRVATQFREATSGALQNDTIAFTLSTTGPAATTDSVITTQLARDCHDASRLRMLRPDGTRPAALTEADSSARFRLRTAPIALATATAQAASRLGDAESEAMAHLATNTDSSVFQVTGAFRVATAANANNGILQASQFDTLTAIWTHPRDAQDVARDTLLVRAANVAAAAWFSLTEGGASVTTYPTSQRTAHIVVQDQAADPGRVYTAMVTSIQGGLDSERVTLRVLSPGILVGQVAINSNTKVRQDGTLQVSVLGDQLRVEYRDPIYGESAIGTVGYAQEVQEAPLLVFTDADGNVLDSATVWSPSRGKLFVRYEDDRVGGNLGSKAIALSLASRRYGLTLGVDDESFSASLAAGSTGTRASWTGSIDLADAFPAVDSNGRAETRYRGEATVTAFSHDNQGNAQTTTVSDFLVIAYPDSAAVLTWSLDTNQASSGKEGLVIGVKDQDFTAGSDDSVSVTLVCSRTGDSVSAVAAREIAGGSYRTGTVIKDTAAPNLSDRVLSCLSADQIVVRYVDPVYGTGAQLVVNEAARPVAAPPGKTFALQEIVTLTSSSPGAVIYYTLDGSTPVPGRSLVYVNPIQIDASTVLKAIATVPGWKDSRVMVETYTKQAIASRLEILDGNGNSIPGGVLTGSTAQIRFKLTTSQANLGTPAVDARTRVGQDEETLGLANTLFLGSSLEYWQTYPLNHNKGGADGNDTVDAHNTDTLVAVWTNPFDPLDVARDTLIIKPAFKAAEVYFTAVPNGPRITTYPDSTTMVYVVVKTNPKDPSLVYQVTISATELGLDDEVVALVEVSPGVFTAQLPVVRGAKSPDVAGTLQVSAGADQLVAVFVDPVFKDTYRGNAGFGQDVQESASLDFIHQDGRLVTPDEIWSPAEGKVYLRYSDDWLAGIDTLIKVRKGKVSLVNRKSGNVIGTDEEEVTLSLVSQSATRGIWEGSVLLRDRASATPADDTLETYYRGEATASVTPHDNKGVVGGAAVTDQLVVAYPNQPAEIIIRDTSGAPVDRVTRAVDIVVKDQVHTQTGDNSITVTVACDATGDKLQSVRLVWNGTAYVADPPVRKGEGAAVQDSILQCRSTDRIVVTYPDPVYTGDVKTGDARWSDEKAAKLYFASVRDGSVITSVADGVDSSFIVFVEGLSPSRDRADTLDVVLLTNQSPKDSLKVRAVETGPLTGVFKVEVPYEFITRPADPKDGRLEANINADVKDNRVIVTASAVIDGKAVKGDIALFSAYNLVVKAWMKDANGDGMADRAYFAFDKKLARLPGSLEEVAWNRHDADDHKRKATGAMLSFLTPDSNVVVADFSKSQFGANLTDIPSGAKPYGLFPSDNVFGGQRALLADSVGPVPVSGVKRPSNLASYSVSDIEKRFYPDTLIIRVSEKLKTATNWSEMIRFSKGCAPYSESVPLKLSKEAEASATDPLEWTLIVDNAPSAQIPLVGDCVFLEVDGRYTDLPGNRPSPLGVPLTGENPKLVIRDFRGFPPVAGMDPGSSGFVLVTNDVKGSQDDGRWSTKTGNGYQVVWIPPVGLEECNNAPDVMKCLERKVPSGYDAKATPMRDIENQSFTFMPVRNYSAVQVIATGRYIARVSIYDNLGVHVRSFVQAFGFWGEEKNPWRATEKGLRSFLVWDLKDKNGQLAGQGVYVWKVNFSFSERKSEVMYTRTGVMRN